MSELCELLISVGIEKGGDIFNKYLEIFEKEHIDMNVLSLVDRDSLTTIGISFGHAVKIVEQMKQRPSAPPQPSVPHCALHPSQPLMGLCLQDESLLCNICKTCVPHSKHDCVDCVGGIRYLRGRLLAQTVHHFGFDFPKKIQEQEAYVKECEQRLQQAKDDLVELRATSERRAAATNKVADWVQKGENVTHSTPEFVILTTLKHLHTLYTELKAPSDQLVVDNLGQSESVFASPMNGYWPVHVWDMSTGLPGATVRIHDAWFQIKTLDDLTGTWTIGTEHTKTDVSDGITAGFQPVIEETVGGVRNKHWLRCDFKGGSLKVPSNGILYNKITIKSGSTRRQDTGNPSGSTFYFHVNRGGTPHKRAGFSSYYILGTVDP